MKLLRSLLFIAVVLVALCYCTTARAMQFRVLSQWDCGKDLKCAIALDHEGDYVLLLAEKGVLIVVVFEGKVIWTKPKEKEA